MGEDYILGTASGYYTYSFTDRKAVSFTPLSPEGGRIEARSYYIDNESNIWIGTKGTGLFIKSPNGGIKSFYRSDDTGADNIANIRIFGDNIWLSTINGVYIVSRQAAH
jgi:ligand-binding sensor domain-containing protein